MCGIAGWYRRGDRAVAAETILEQCNAIRHRGPDDSGELVDRDFGMGMRRLSIIDVEGGRQPITTPDGRYSITFNGEIYNHPDLRPLLEMKGFSFRTQSDTETLLAAYVHWGDEAWLKLEGMYAVAIWDHAERTLTLARDPVGIKPLYLTEQRGGLAFASEIKALLPVPEHGFTVDERAIYDFLRFGQVQRPRSVYREVRQLDPGHVLHIGAEGAATVHPFWKPRFAVNNGLSHDEWVEETRDRLLRTVKSHLLSDVPVGAFLSAGVDSSAVTAAMIKQSDQRFTAFSVGFPDHGMDESVAAARTAKHLGCDHLVLPIAPQEARDIIPEMQRHFDEPLGTRSGAIASWYLAEFAAEHVKVVLCGDGGDELFAGYKRQRNAMRMHRWRGLIRAGGPLAGAIARLPIHSFKQWNRVRGWVEPVRRAAELENGFQRFAFSTEISSEGLREQLFQPDFRERNDISFEEFEAEYFSDPDWQGLDILQQIMLGDLIVHMPAGPLTRLDRTSMAHSLEARVPFLSHRFVDWAFTIPNELKARGQGKYVLREAVRPWLPEGLLDRKKQGFQVPISDWFSDDLAHFARQAWQESGLAEAGYLDEAAVEAIFADHATGLADHGKLIYTLTVLGCWWNAWKPRR